MTSLQYSRDILKKYREKLFMVRAPRSLLYDPEEIKMLGIPITYGEDGAKKKSVTDLDTVMIPAIKIVEIFKNGGTIYVVNRDDIITLGELLTEVLELYKYSVNVNDLEEKQIIEELLDSLTNINQGFIERRIEEELKQDDGLGNDLFMDVDTKPKIDITKFEV